MRLRNLEEGLNETKVCKVCGDKMHKPTTDCAHDCHDERGDHWITEGTWAWPDQAWQVTALNKLLKSPLPADTAADSLYDII